MHLLNHTSFGKPVINHLSSLNTTVYLRDDLRGLKYLKIPPENLKSIIPQLAGKVYREYDFVFLLGENS